MASARSRPPTGDIPNIPMANSTYEPPTIVGNGSTPRIFGAIAPLYQPLDVIPSSEEERAAGQRSEQLSVELPKASSLIYFGP
jgi:hypothetical protein